MTSLPKNLKSWTPLGPASVLLGVSQECLRLYIHGKNGRPIIPHRKGRNHGFDIRPCIASEILTKHGVVCTRLHHEDPNEAPADSWAPLRVAAQLLGVSNETLRLYIHGKGGRPLLPCRKYGRGYAVQPLVAYKILTGHGTNCMRLEQQKCMAV